MGIIHFFQGLFRRSLLGTPPEWMQNGIVIPHADGRKSCISHPDHIISARERNVVRALIVCTTLMGMLPATILCGLLGAFVLYLPIGHFSLMAFCGAASVAACATLLREIVMIKEWASQDPDVMARYATMSRLKADMFRAQVNGYVVCTEDDIPQPRPPRSARNTTAREQG